MDRAGHIAALEAHGRALTDVAEGCGADAPVPTCPGWRVRDLLTHLSYVHRWATGVVAEGRDEPPAVLGETDVLSVGPGDDELFSWFREGHRALVDTLRRADPSLQCYAFLPAPSPLAFWCRRQAHETAVHRADAEAAAGRVARFAPDFAVDGIDELVMGFAPTPRAKVTADQRRVLLIEPTDAEDRWLVGMGPEGIDAERATGPSDGTLRGDAGALYLVLWNRARPETLGVRADDPGLVDLWSASLQVRWRS